MKPNKMAAALWIRLAKCYGLVLREVQRDDGRFELTLPQFDVVTQLLRHPEGMTPSALSRALLVTAGNVTGIVARLVTQGLVERTAHPFDGRAAILRLTRLGRRKALAGVAWHERRLGDLFAGLRASDQGRLRESLDRLRAVLEPAEKSETRRSA
jgi:DNA-binding MarR family transcriptional regulator